MKLFQSHSNPPPKLANPATRSAKSGLGKSGEAEGDVFMKKINKWSHRDRTSWTYDKRPSHRNLTIGATLSQGELLNKNASDLSALHGLEKSLQAMDSYMAEGNQEDRAHAADVTSNMSDVKECLRIREISKIKAKETVAKDSEKNRATGPMFTIDERPNSPGVYRPIKPFDPDNLESVRRHNMFRQKQVDEMTKNMENENQAHNFHALPMPGYVPYVVPDTEQTKTPDRHQQIPSPPQDSLVEFISGTELPPKIKAKKALDFSKPTKTKESAADDFQAFFVTEGDKAEGEESSSEQESDLSGSSEESESNDDDIDAELEELTKKEKELMKNYARVSRQRDRVAKAAAATGSKQTPIAVNITPRTAPSYNTPQGTPRLSTPRTTPRRPTSTDVLIREASGGAGPSILDLDATEREALWRLKKEQKQQQMRREIEIQQSKDVSFMSLLQCPWRNSYV